MFQDFFLNILAEAIGIVITVFWLDKLIKKREREREELRWLPAKQLVYYHLTYSITTLLEFLSGDRIHDTSFIYFFGEFRVRSSVDILEFPNQPVSDFVTKITENYNDRLNDIVRRRAESAENVLEGNAQLLEPELLKLLIEYKMKLQQLASTYDYQKSEAHFDKETLEFVLIIAVQSIFNLLRWLEKQKTGVEISV
jgi:hypothetical protein